MRWIVEARVAGRLGEVGGRHEMARRLLPGRKEALTLSPVPTNVIGQSFMSLPGTSLLSHSMTCQSRGRSSMMIIGSGSRYVASYQYSCRAQDHDLHTTFVLSPLSNLLSPHTDR